VTLEPKGKGGEKLQSSFLCAAAINETPRPAKVGKKKKGKKFGLRGLLGLRARWLSGSILEIDGGEKGRSLCYRRSVSRQSVACRSTHIRRVAGGGKKRGGRGNVLEAIMKARPRLPAGVVSMNKQGKSKEEEEKRKFSPAGSWLLVDRHGTVSVKEKKGGRRGKKKGTLVFRSSG